MNTFENVNANTNNHFSLFFYMYAILISYLVYKQYDKTINKYSKIYAETFKNLSKHKKKYIAKNIIKSNILEILSYISFPTLYSVIFNYGNLDNVIKIAAICYVSNDFVALLTVEKIPNRTKYHHTVTTLFCFYTQFISFYDNNIAKLLFVYCVTSCYSYNVNRFLAMRYLYNDKESVELRLKAIVCYFIACSLNWGYHIIWLMFNIGIFDVWLGIYYTLICVLIYDDIYLLKWLHNYDFTGFESNVNEYDGDDESD